ncbi:hypothetical protein Misp03_10070 [Microbispora sp. NBRC 16548]|nr:hypothetical protein Misp03_10070 [Microbispora sp. NBRC 16548]
MTTSAVAEQAGHARHTYRLRVPSAALAALLTEWDRCRWVWNECVAQSRAAHQAKQTCGPAQLDKMLTGWRTEHEWLRTGASVPQQQTIRDFAKSRAKALKDIKARRRTQVGQEGREGPRCDRGGRTSARSSSPRPPWPARQRTPRSRPPSKP